jgi:hypothetical protein
MGSRQLHSTKPGSCRVNHHYNNRSNENDGRPLIPGKQGLDNKTDRETEAPDSLLLPEIVGTERRIPELRGLLTSSGFQERIERKDCRFFVRVFCEIYE